MEGLQSTAPAAKGGQVARSGILLSELQSVLETVTAEPALDDEFKALVEGSGGGTPLFEMLRTDPAQALMALRSLRKSDKGVAALRPGEAGDDDRLTPEEIDFFNKNRPKTRIEQARLLRVLRGNDAKVGSSESFLNKDGKVNQGMLGETKGGFILKQENDGALQLSPAKRSDGVQPKGAPNEGKTRQAANIYLNGVKIMEGFAEFLA